MFPVPLTENDVAGLRILVSACCLIVLAYKWSGDGSTYARDPRTLAAWAVDLTDAWIEELEPIASPRHPERSNP